MTEPVVVLTALCGRCADEHQSQRGAVGTVEVRDGELYWCWSAVNRRSRRQSARIAPVLADAVGTGPTPPEQVANLTGVLAQAGGGAGVLDPDGAALWAVCPVHGPGYVQPAEVMAALRARRPGQRSRAVVSWTPRRSPAG